MCSNAGSQAAAFEQVLCVNHVTSNSEMSLVMRKPAFCICENKDADQPRGNREADLCLYFRYTDGTIPILPKSEISSVYLSSVAVQPGLCQTRSETPKTGFLTTMLKCRKISAFPKPQIFKKQFHPIFFLNQAILL